MYKYIFDVVVFGYNAYSQIEKYACISDIVNL